MCTSLMCLPLFVSSWQSEIFWSVCPPDSSLSMTNLPASPHKDGSEKLKIAASAGESMFSVILNPNYKLSSPRGMPS